MKKRDYFGQTSMQDLKRGYLVLEQQESIVCLFCGERFDQGKIYQDSTGFYEAGKFMRKHIEEEHGSVFESLLSMGKKSTGLTEIQNKMVKLFFQGFLDEEIAKVFGKKNTSTIRNHRFILRERAKQARVFLAIMELLEEEIDRRNKESWGDDQEMETPMSVQHDEEKKILQTYFKDGLDGPLWTMPRKEKRKYIILKHIAKRFSTEKQYSEKEINTILKDIYDDFAALRRYLVEYGFMQRTPDGKEYCRSNLPRGKPLGF